MKFWVQEVQEAAVSMTIFTLEFGTLLILIRSEIGVGYTNLLWC